MNCIVAVEDSWGIGCKGRLLTYLPGDLKYFKEKTLGKVVVLGRKTLSTFPKGNPLKDRINIILTNDKSFTSEGAIVKHSINEVLEELEKYNEEDIFIIGGESIYNQFIQTCKTAYVTKIKANFNSDVFFPNLDLSEEWELVEESETQEYDGIEYIFCKYMRING
ncbi:dihydrofolate reductase [Natranaerovirga pectinivora]|uniref:dihydrofolate reductase n=1 Tax=Natranaerovirga pectinivora TaxID=682400 RepID=A0A4R3MNW9_9FIRM|nr:dihydrofolate reductase [Natranaerovirga pectinivora]TCT14379.1 dihydrofolate reductase [Natranaerovirga pectinivora]